jgi:soluble lytic murein transglycosylase-like protein
MPFHAKANGYKEIDLYNPYINIKISCMLLSELCKKYNGDIDKILAQYNGGRREAIKVNNRRVPETRHYVKRGIERYTALSEM